MINTYNRQPLSFSSNKDYDKQFLYSSFNGINDNKNVLSVDQESFADANNIYVSDDNLLVSRPPIKSIGITNVLKVFTFNNKILVLKDDFTLLAYNQLNEEPIATLQYDIPENEYKINCLQVEDKIYVFTDLTISNNPAFYALFVNNNEFKDAIDYIYTPITTLVTNNIDDKYESPNFLTSAEKTRFIYSTLSFVDFSRLVDKKININVDNNTYTVDNWKRENEIALVNKINNNGNDIIDIKSINNINISLKYTNNIISVSFDDKLYYNLPYIDNMFGIPYLSEDCLYVFAFTTDGLIRCDIADNIDSIYKGKSIFTWTKVKYFELDNDIVNMNISKRYSVALANFITKDEYAYIITFVNPVGNANDGENMTSYLYAQYVMGNQTRYITKLLGFYSNDLVNNYSRLSDKYLKMNIHYDNLENNKITPTIISFLADNDRLKSIGFNTSSNASLVMILLNIKEVTIKTEVLNGDVITIKDASFYNRETSAVSMRGGYLTNLVENKDNLYGFKIQRWLLNNTRVEKDFNTSIIKHGDLVSFIPITTIEAYDEEERSFYHTGNSGSLIGTFTKNYLDTNINKEYHTVDLYFNCRSLYSDIYIGNVLGGINIVGNINENLITIGAYQYLVDENDDIYRAYNGEKEYVGTIKKEDYHGTTMYLIKIRFTVDFDGTTGTISMYTYQHSDIDYQIGNLDINTGEITLNLGGIASTLNYTLSENIYNYFGKYVRIKEYYPLPIFKQVIDCSQYDTFTVNIKNGTSGQSLKQNDSVTFVDNLVNNEDYSNYAHDITGIVSSIDNSSLFLEEFKNTQLTYYVGSEPDFNYLTDNVDFRKGTASDIKISYKIKDIENNSVSYNVLVVCSLEYNINETTSVSNVINNFTLEYKSDKIIIPDYVPFNGMKLIPGINVKSGNYIEYNRTNALDGNILVNFAYKYKISNDGNKILSNAYIYNIGNDNLIPLIVSDNDDFIFSSAYTHDSSTTPISYTENVYYTSDNILYTNKLSEDKQITLDIKTNGNYTQKVFDKKAILNEYFLSFNNLVEISSTRRNKDNEFLLYLPNATEQKYVGNVNELHLLSSSEVGVFLDSEIWTLKSLGSNNDKTYELWSNIKTKLNLGIKAGSEVITSIDGSSVIFATSRGIANMHYQENVQSADQILGYLSDAIQYTYDYYRDKAIKFVVYKYLILCYLENDNKILLFDIKRNAWWKWSYKANISRIFAYNDIVYILSNNSLYKFDTQYNDYTDDGDKIDWSITTQKLHLGNINNTKFIKRLTIMALGDKKEICKVRTNMFRQLNHTVKEDYLDIEIDDLRTLVKVFSFMSVNQFQLMLSADLNNTDTYQLKINTIGITYQLKGGV